MIKSISFSEITTKQRQTKAEKMDLGTIHCFRITRFKTKIFICFDHKNIL